MKKANLFTYVLLFTFLIVSCSKDDNNNNTTADDLLIGAWKPIKDVDSSSGSNDVYTYNTCEQKSRITFEASGNIIALDFYEDENTGDCIDHSSDFVSGSWEKTSLGNYKVTTTYYDDYTQQNVTYTDTYSISFPTSNTMKIVTDSSYYIEYTRV